jgi:protein SCO1/2
VITLQRVLALILLSLLAAIGFVLLSTKQSGNAASKSVNSSAFDGPTMPPGLRAANFSLLDQNGRRVSLAQYRGKVVVLTFIHSLCHGACPLMVEQIKGALNQLPASGRGIPAIGVSVAPWEDTRAHRAQFLAKHQLTSRLEYLSGSRSELGRIWHAYAMRPVQGNGRVDDHSTFVLLIDKRGIERVGFAVSELTPEGLAHDIRVLQRQPA